MALTNGPIDRIVWVGAREAIEDGDAQIATEHATALTMFRAIKALLAEGYGARSLVWTVLTFGTQAIRAGEQVQARGASLHGLVGSMAKEYRHWGVTLVDVGVADEIPWSALSKRPADPAGDPVAWRAGQWYRRQFRQLSFERAPEPAYAQQGIYVVIGGAGGLGEVWTQWMLENYHANVVWVGRRAADNAIEAACERLSAFGPRPVYIQADAGAVNGLRQVVAQIEKMWPHRRINGVVHSAIVLQDRSLVRMDETTFSGALRAKVDVSMRLADAFADHALDFVLFFSSLQSISTSAGQSNYAAGCTFKDAYAAQLRQRRAGVVKVVNWGWWGSVGVVASEDYRRRMAQMGLASIEPPLAFAALQALLSGPVNQMAVLATLHPDAIAQLCDSRQAMVCAPRAPIDWAAVNTEVRSQAQSLWQRITQAPHAATQASMQGFEPLRERLISLLWTQLQTLSLFNERPQPLSALVTKLEPHYGRWLAESVRVLQEGGFLQSEDGGYRTADPLPSSAQDAWTAWEADKAQWQQQLDMRAHVQLLEATLRALPQVLTGRTPATDVLFADSSMQRVEGVYKGNAQVDYFNTVLGVTLGAYVASRLKVDATPLRVLEVGAGTGGTSVRALSVLEPFRAQVADYCYTDLSRAFLHHAQDHFKPQHSYLTCALFDVEKSPSAQGIACGTYDVVIATNVLHATRDIRRTLRNVKATLRQGGLLLINEMSRNGGLVMHLTFGLLKGWWSFEDEALRLPGGPALCAQTWQRVLEAEGLHPVYFPTEEASKALDQQVIAACSDGVIHEKTADVAALLPTSRDALIRAAEPSSAASAPEPMESPVARRHVASSAQPRREELKGLSIEQCVQWDLKEHVAEVLKLRREQINTHENLAEFGADSIHLRQLAQRLSAHYGLDLTPALFFTHPSLARLGAYLLGTHGPQIQSFYPEPGAQPAAVAGESVRVSKHRSIAKHTAPASRSSVPTSSGVPEPIAIIGMSGRFPQARSVEEMWELLVQEREAVQEIPLERFDWRELYARQQIAGKWLGALPGVAEFDPLFFEILPREAHLIDPRQRLLLQEAWNALEEAGYGGEQVARERIGMFVGVEQGDYQLLVGGPGATLTGTHDGILASRLSYCLNLRGPAMAINTACSSGLVAAHQACQSLRAGECDAALAAGVNLVLTPNVFMGMSPAGMLSEDGRCYAFDRRANGIVPGEAIVVVLLKRLSRAQADGDPIHAVIRGSGINYDGRTNGITAPSGAAQAELINEVYEHCAVNARDIGYVVTHGTGTRLGDPVEINALNEVFKSHTADEGFCALSSTKTNFGHSFAASGLVSLVSAVQALKHAIIPASLHCEQQNEYIEWARSAFYVNHKTRAWPSKTGAPRRAAVSAFGMSGTNAHMVVESYEDSEQPIASAAPYRLLVLSAKSAEALRNRVRDLIETLKRGEWDAARLDAMSCTLLCGRHHFTHRCAVAFEDRDNAIHLLQQADSPERLANVFRGTVARDFSEQKGLTHYAQELLTRLPSLHAEHSQYQEVLHVLADLFCQGYQLSWSLMFAEQAPRRVALPTYPFVRQEYWAPQETPALGSAARELLHPLVHENTSDLDGPRFTSRFSGTEFFLGDHRVHGRPVLLPVAYLEMARAALERCAGLVPGDRLEICFTDVELAWPVAANPTPVELHISLLPYEEDESDERIGFEIYSDDQTHADSQSILYAQGTAVWVAAAEAQQLDLRTLLEYGHERSVQGCYDVFQAGGVAYGAALRGLQTLYIGEDGAGSHALALLQVPASIRASVDSYVLHPSLLQGALQAAMSWMRETSGQAPPPLLRSVKSLQIFGRLSEPAYALIRRATQSAAFDIQISDSQGTIRACLRGVEFTELPAKIAAPIAAPPTANQSTSVQLMTFQEQWKEQAFQADSVLPLRRLICFVADESMSRAIAETLRSLNPQLQVIFVEPAACSGKRDAQRYGIVQSDRLSYVQAFAAISADHGSVDAVVYGWGLTQAREEQGWSNLVRMLQALAFAGLKCNRVMLCAAFVDARSRCHAESWLALERSIKVLLPQSSTGLLLQEGEVGHGVSLRDWTVRMWQELQDERTVGVLYGADGRRHVPKMAARALVDAAPVLRQGGTYWISGGSGGLGWLFAQHLCRKYGAQVILSGRRELDDTIRQRLQALEEAGGKAIYVSADVGDEPQMRRCFEQGRARFGRIDGVIHAAGVVESSILYEKELVRFEEALRPKIRGTLVLDAVLEEDAPDFICYFSSVSAVLGDFGGGDYALGNRFEMLHAQYAQTGLKRIAICWPLWTDGGMNLGDSDSTLLYLKGSGQEGLPPEQGLHIFEQLLAQPAGHYVVFYGQPQSVHRFLERKTAGLVGTAAAASESAAALSELSPAVSERTAAFSGLPSAMSEPAPASRPRRAALTGLSVEQSLLWELKELVSEVSSLDRGQIEAQRNLTEYGFDSISLTKLAQRLSQHFEIQLTPAVFFSCPTIARLSAHLLSDFSAPIQALYGQPTAARSVSSNPAATVPAPRRGRSRHLRASSRAVAARQASALEPIAVIGMSGRFPQARSVEEMWELLVQGREAVREIPLERFDWRELYASQQIVSKWLGALPGVAEFDPLFFEISPREAQLMDPRQRLLLQEAWNALEEAGYGGGQFERERIGMFVGVEQGDYQLLAGGPGNSLTGNHDGILASRLSYCLNLRGPAMAINTSCSSGLVAAHQACQSLRADECDAALAAGVNLVLTPLVYTGMGQAGMLSEEGRCYAFDRRANGLVPGEAVVVVLLKRLSRAQADGDPIHAVIRGSGLNYDGKTNGITAPNGAAQAQLIQDVYRQYAVNPRDIGYIVTHGTGTRLGDPVEINALNEVFKSHTADEGFCALSSTKTNFGHSFAASGLVSLVSAVQALKHAIIPASLHCEQRNEYIEWARSAFYVNKTTKPWPSEPGVPRRAGVSAFGMSGTNAHMVVESYEGAEPSGLNAAPCQLLALSAKSPEALQQRVCDLIETLQGGEWDAARLKAMSHTLLCGRQHFRHRCAVAVADRDSAVHLLQQVGTTERLPSVFRGTVPREFSGQPVLMQYAQELLGRMGGRSQEAAQYQQWLCALADLHCQGYELSWGQLYGEHPPQRISLPTYPFAREQYWINELAHQSAAERPASNDVLHPLLHTSTSLTTQPLFTVNFRGDEPFLADHRVNGRPILPGVAYLEMARVAVALARGEASQSASAVELRNVVWLRPLVVERETEAHLALDRDADGFDFRVYTVRESQEHVHAQGRVVCVDAASDVVDLDALRSACRVETLTADQCYAGFVAAGLGYGPAHRAMTRLWSGERQALARLELPHYLQASANAYGLHPSLLDCALHSIVALEAQDGERQVKMPFALDSLRYVRPCPLQAWAWVRRDAADAPGSTARFDVDLCDDQGKVAVALRGFSVRALGAEARPQRAVHVLASETALKVPPAPPVIRPTQILPRAVVLSAQQIEDYVRTTIRECVSGALRMPAARIDNECSFSDYGVDSILAVSLINELNKQFGITLNTTVIFDHNTVDRFTGFILSRHDEAIRRLLQPPVAPAQERVAIATSVVPAGRVPHATEQRVIPFSKGTARVSEASVASVDPSDSYLRVLIERPSAIDELSLVRSPVPALGDHDVMICVRSYSLNFSDLLLVRGLYPSMPEYPFTPGAEVSGVVVDVGARVRRLRRGDEVFASQGNHGGFANLFVCHEGMAFVKPATLDFDAMCALPTVALTMIEAFEKIDLQRGERILIQTATGGTGLIAVQLAQHSGAEVFATAGAPHKLDYLQ